MKTIMLLGCAGYLAKGAIESLLLPLDATVIGVDNLTYGGIFDFKKTRFTFVNCDIRNKKKLTELFDTYRPDTVIHSIALVGDGACQVSPEATKAINDEGTRTVAELCAKWKSHLIYTSTCSVYGVNNDLLDEESPTNPLSLYAETKLAGEAYVKQLNRHTIFRLGTVSGYTMNKSGRFRNDLVANLLTIKAFQGKNLSVHGEQIRPMVHCQDVAEVFAAAVKLEKNGTYILAHQNYTIKEIAETVASVIPAKIEVTGLKFEDQRNYKVSNLKLLKAGFEVNTSLKESIKEMVEAFKSGRVSDVYEDLHHNEKWLRKNGQTLSYPNPT